MKKETEVIYSYLSQKSIKEQINNHKENDLADLANIIDRITLWKINRQVDYSNIQEIEKHLKQIEGIKDLSELKDDDEKTAKVKDALQMLINTKGIRLPLASTILHFFNPVFPICDQRAYRAVYKVTKGLSREYPKNITELRKTHKSETGKKTDFVDLYFDYVEECTDAVNSSLKEKYFVENGVYTQVTLQNIDKYLYAVDEGPVRY